FRGTAARAARPHRPAADRTRPRLRPQHAVQFLQRHHADVAADTGLDALHGRRGTLHRRHAGDVHRYCGRTDLVSVDAWAGVAVRGVDHHVALARADRVDGRQFRAVRAGLFEVLAHLVARDTVAPQHFPGARCGRTT